MLKDTKEQTGRWVNPKIVQKNCKGACPACGSHECYGRKTVGNNKQVVITMYCTVCDTDFKEIYELKYLHSEYRKD